MPAGERPIVFASRRSVVESALAVSADTQVQRVPSNVYPSIYDIRPVG
ncbi:hypothetical protein [Microbacterium sp. NPDC055683]